MKETKNCIITTTLKGPDQHFLGKMFLSPHCPVNCLQQYTKVARAVCKSRATHRALRPKIHGYTGCKRMGFVRPDSMKLAMGHLLHSEAAPCFTNPCATMDSRSCAPCTLWWSAAVDPLSDTAVPLHLTKFTVPFVRIVATVYLKGT